MPVVFRDRAEADLAEIAAYIAADNPRRAASFVNELIDRCLAIASRPLAARERPEIGDGVRLVVHGKYVVVYRIDDGDILILRVVHGARDVGGLDL